MEYYAVYENIELGDSFGTTERNRITDAFPTYEKAYEEFVELGGLSENSNLTIETLHETTLEEEMQC